MGSGCGCGGKSAAAKVEYVVKKPDGTSVVRTTEHEAKTLATRLGTTYTARTVAR